MTAGTASYGVYDKDVLFEAFGRKKHLNRQRKQRREQVNSPYDPCRLQIICKSRDMYFKA